MCALALSLGCDSDPVATDDFGGEALLSLRPLARPNAPVNAEMWIDDRFEAPPRIATFWSPNGPRERNPENWVEDPVAAHTFAMGPIGDINIFDPPAASSLWEASEGVHMGVGTLLIYIDTNADDDYTAGEQLVGAFQKFVILYAPEEIAAEHSPTAASIPEGMHLYPAPMPCGPLPTEISDGDCGVPMGVVCEEDAECGAGACWPRSGGRRTVRRCAVTEPPPDGCRPANAELVLELVQGGGMMGEPGPIGAWVALCETDEDCGAPGALHCVMPAGRCEPIRGPVLPVSERQGVPSYCGALH